MRSALTLLLILVISSFLFISCEKTGMESGVSDVSSGFSSSGGSNVGGNPGDTSTQAGLMTAGEWNDFANWPFWQNLMANDTFKIYQSKWKFYCTEKWEFTVKDINQQPVADATISISTGGTSLWQGKTNKFGVLNAIPDIYATSLPANMQYTVSYRNQTQATGQLSTANRSVVVNLPGAAVPENTVDLMFVVDATGSMGDEISYLKNELLDVLNRSDNQLPGTLRYASVFYRDKTDDYVTKASGFSTNKSDIVNFVKAQNAGGGGDYPEAVEEALKTAMQQSWSSTAKARLLFLILDAPPHEDSLRMQTVREQVKLAASKGIMIIPVSASGVDKATEFILRFMAQATNSTYTFITNHSGIGNNHITATVGAYQVEYLNNLMVRLITKYGGN
jgi:hypothetical protein